MSKNNKSKRAAYQIPSTELKSGEVMHNGQNFEPGMVGAFYASSLEYHMITTPQYANAGNLVAPCFEEVRNVFKPKRPYGTFGALVSDSDESQYRVDVARSIVELPTLESVVDVADIVDNSWSTIEERIVSEISYRTSDPKAPALSFADAMALQASFREHNLKIQSEIEDLVKERGYSPTLTPSGRVVTKKYPDTLLSEISQLAKKKKSITGFSLKVQIVGKHTIAKDGYYLKSSVSDADIETLRSKLNYREKETYSQGVIRLGTVNIPIQSVQQLKRVIEILKTSDVMATTLKGKSGKEYPAMRLERKVMD